MNDVAAGLPVAVLARKSAARLVEWGRQAITQAGSFDEVRELRCRAEALRAYQRARGASLDAVNAATQLRLLADRRMGEELAQTARAKGIRLGGNTRLPPGEEPTYAQLGIDKMQAARCQQLAAVPSDIFAAVFEVHTEGRAPITTAAVLRMAERAEQLGQTADEIRNAPLPEADRSGQRFWAGLDRAVARELPVEKSTGEYEWDTPSYIIDPARQVLVEIDLDPASDPIAQCRIRARVYYTRATDGLTQHWRGRVWLNPPYAQELIGRFVTKLCAHVTAGEVTAAIMLTDNRTDTQWFHQAAALAQRICFIEGRVSFLRSTGTPGRPMNGSCVFYFGEASDTFSAAFGQFGLVYPEPVNLPQEPK